MCIAIICVVFYHLALRGIPIGRLNIGYIGVDIFMLLSGYGIGKSLQHNSLSKFYKNRVRKIMPIWTLMISLSWSIYAIGGGKMCITHLVANLSTIFFYFNPDLLPEWYLATLIMFYALSPILYMILKKAGWFGALLIFDEQLNLWQWAGVVTAVFAFWLLSRSGKREGIVFTHNAWIVLLVCAAVLGALSGLYDKFLMGNLGLPAFFVQSWFNVYQMLMMMSVLVVWQWWQRNCDVFNHLLSLCLYALRYVSRFGIHW